LPSKPVPATSAGSNMGRVFDDAAGGEGRPSPPGRTPPGRLLGRRRDDAGDDKPGAKRWLDPCNGSSLHARRITASFRRRAPVAERQRQSPSDPRRTGRRPTDRALGFRGCARSGSRTTPRATILGGCLRRDVTEARGCGCGNAPIRWHVPILPR